MRLTANSNDATAKAAAEECLKETGSAVAAVVAGFIAAAGERPGVLLGPLTLLVGGVGVGTRAFDGRCRQPGLGAKRPRGIGEDAAATYLQRVASPASIPAAMVACGYDGFTRFATLVSGGVAAAKRQEEPTRVALLEEVKRVGGALFQQTGVQRAILREAGKGQQGWLTDADFSTPRSYDVAALKRVEGDESWWEVPWARDPEVQEAFQARDAGSLGLVIAVDPRGVFAAAAFRRAEEGLPVPELGVSLPPAAVPVRRGVPRVPPGVPLPMPVPVALRLDATGNPVEIVAHPGVAELAADLSLAPLRIRRNPRTLEVEDLSRLL